MQSNAILLDLGRYHRTVGIPSDYFGIMGPMFLHAIRPCLEEHNMLSEEMEDAWLFLFAHMARVMTHGHKYGEATATKGTQTTTADKQRVATGLRSVSLK